MHNELRLYERYPDFLDAGADADLINLIGELDAVGQAGNPPPYLGLRLQQALQARQVGKRRSISERWPRMPRTLRRGPGVAWTAILTVLLLTGAAYSVTPILDRAFGMNPGMHQIVSDNLGKSLNVSQTVNGFTVRIERVYADANRIVIGYTITAPAGRTFNSMLPFGSDGHLPVLMDSQDTELSVLPATIAGPGVRGNTVGGLLFYDGSAIAGQPKELALRLTFPTISGFERTGSQASAVREEDIHGPFAFAFTVPFDGGRAVDLHQAADVGGRDVILERVVLTLTETRVYLRGVGPGADVRANIDGQEYPLSPPGPIPSPWSANSEWYYTSSTPLLGKHGAWTLTVNPPQHAASGGATMSGGPWVFHFTVP